MNFSGGANVLDRNGENLGSVDRVVIAPNGGKVTHIVVRKGFLFATDKVLPVDMVARTEEDVVHLNVAKGQVEDLPDFIDTEFIPLDEEEISRHGYTYGDTAASPVYWYPVLGSTSLFGGPGYWGAYPPPGAFPYEVSQNENIPSDTVALQEGAEVVDTEGEKIGKLEKVLVGKHSEQVTHLVVSKGTFNKESKIIPAGWIKAIKEDGVQLSVKSKFVDRLRPYEE